jgi:hypothetical protein
MKNRYAKCDCLRVTNPPNDALFFTSSLHVSLVSVKPNVTTKRSRVPFFCDDLAGKHTTKQRPAGYQFRIELLETNPGCTTSAVLPARIIVCGESVDDELRVTLNEQISLSSHRYPVALRK